MFGWIGWAMCLSAIYLIGEKNVKAFYLFILADIALIIDAALYRHWSLLAACVVLIVMNVVNLRKWKR